MINFHLSKKMQKEEKEIHHPKMKKVAKFKRDLRVYKYTLDLTRKEWKKNQQLALQKMNAHRKVIGKYKDDKIMLLNIVSDLEGKLNEANTRLREGQNQQKKANELLGYDFTAQQAPDDVPTPQDLNKVQSCNKAQKNALKMFAKKM